MIQIMNTIKIKTEQLSINTASVLGGINEYKPVSSFLHTSIYSEEYNRQNTHVGISLWFIHFDIWSQRKSQVLADVECYSTAHCRQKQTGDSEKKKGVEKETRREK